MRSFSSFGCGRAAEERGEGVRAGAHHRLLEQTPPGDCGLRRGGQGRLRPRSVPPPSLAPAVTVTETVRGPGDCPPPSRARARDPKVRTWGLRIPGPTGLGGDGRWEENYARSRGRSFRPCHRGPLAHRSVDQCCHGYLSKDDYLGRPST